MPTKTEQPKPVEKGNIFNLERRRLLEIEGLEGHITGEGVNKIIGVVAENTGRFFDGIDVQHMMREVDWHWMTAEGKRQGTLPKRLSRYLYKQYRIKMDAELLAQIGNVARNNTVMEPVLYIDIDDEFTWSDGHFGDAGSCFWMSRSHALDMLRGAGAVAVRHWEKSGDRYIGVGRCFFVPTHKSGQFVGMNAYGPLHLSHLAGPIAKLTDTSYKRIGLTNKGSPTYSLYINGENGFLFGKEQDIRSVDQVDLDIHDPYVKTCGECGDEGWYQDMRQTPHNDEYYHFRCYEETFFQCSNCGNIQRRNDNLPIRGFNRWRYCSEECSESMRQRETERNHRPPSPPDISLEDLIMQVNPGTWNIEEGTEE